MNSNPSSISLTSVAITSDNNHVTSNNDVDSSSGGASSSNPHVSAIYPSFVIDSSSNNMNNNNPHSGNPDNNLSHSNHNNLNNNSNNHNGNSSSHHVLSPSSLIHPVSNSINNNNAISNNNGSVINNNCIVHKPTLVEWGRTRFLIMDAPNPSTLPSLVESLKKRNCVCVVRVCEPTYDNQILIKNHINHIDLPFADGDAPPPHVVKAWINLVRSIFDVPSDTNNNNAAVTNSNPSNNYSPNPNSNGINNVNNNNNMTNNPIPCIGVHCVAGLGRAPILVAIALVEYGMSSIDAVDFVRKRRRGAINAKQLKFMESYKPVTQPQPCCTVM